MKIPFTIRVLLCAIGQTLLAVAFSNAQSINQAEPIAHGSAAMLYVDANRNVVNSQLECRIVAHLGATSIYVSRKNWKMGGDSSQVYVSDSSKGVIRVYLTSSQTRNTLLGNKYYAEMWQTDSVGTLRRIASGQILMSYSTIEAVAGSGAGYDPEVSDTLNMNVVRAEVDPTATAKARVVFTDSSNANVVRAEVDPTATAKARVVFTDSSNANVVRAEVDPTATAKARVVFTDSSNANVVRAEVDPTATAKARVVFTDSSNANVVRAEVDPTAIKADTASLAPIADQMYPRTTGAAVDTSQFIGLKRTETIFGQKTMAGTFRVTTTDAPLDTSSGVKFSLGSGRTDFLFYRGNPAAGNGGVMRFGGPYNGAQWDVTIANYFGQITFSGPIAATSGATLGYVDVYNSSNRVTYLNALTLKGFKWTNAADTDTLHSWWFNGAPLLRLRGAATDDEALVVGSAVMQRGIKAFGRIIVQQDTIFLTVAPNETLDASTGNVYRVLLSQNDTLTVTNMVDGQSVTLWIRQANNFTLLLPGINWPSGVAPTITATANRVDRITITMIGGILRGDYVQNYLN